MLGFCAISEAPISDLGDKSVYASAQISAFADVSAFASVFYDVSGNIVCYADVVASPNAIYWGYANVNGTAEVSALAQNISSAIAYIDGNATVSAYANRTLFFTADINGTADVTANGYRIQFADASVIGTANVTALGSEIYSAKATVEGYAYVTGLANATYSGYGFINANATITANGVIVGEGWTPVVPDAETWSDITPSSDIWTAVTPSSEDWLNVAIENLDNGGDYKASGLLTYPEVNDISVDANTTAIVMNGTNGGNVLNTSSSGMVNWGSDNDAFQQVSYIQNENNGNINPDFLWVSYYNNNIARSNDSIYANDQFNSDAYWISLINVLIGNSAPPVLHNKNSNTTSSYLSSGEFVLPYIKLEGIIKKESQYIAVGFGFDDFVTNFYTAKSSDGLSWEYFSTIANINDSSGYLTIASSSSQYALVGFGYDDITGYNDIITVNSTNGTSFNLTNTIGGSFTFPNICSVYGNKFVFVNSDGFNSDIYTSNDNITWTLSTNLSLNVKNIIWDGSQYIVCGLYNLGSAIATSTDGITWSAVQVVYTPPSNSMGSSVIAYSGSQYVIVGIEYGSPNNIISLVSTNLSTWTRYVAISNSGGNDPYSIIFANNKYIFVGATDLIATSADGITWTQQSTSGLPADATFNEIIWDGSKYITVGYSSPSIYAYDALIATSPDGVTWTQRTIASQPTSLTNVASGSSVIVPPNGLVMLCSNVSLYYPDRDLYTAYDLTEAQINTIMGAAVSPLNITDISDTADLTWIKRSYIYTPYDTTGQLYPAMAQELWYAINNTNDYIVSSPTITYADVFDAQTVSLTSWSGVNLVSPFQNLVPGTNIWTEVNPGTDTWLRQG